MTQQCNPAAMITMREWNFSAEILPQVMPLFFTVQVSQSDPANQQSLELAERRSSNTTGTSSQQSQTDIDAPSLEGIGGKKPQGQGQNGKQSGANTNVAAKPPAAYQEGQACANCLEPGHPIARCQGPADEHGSMPGCPSCNKLDHIYEQCPKYNPDAPNAAKRLAKVMLQSRQNRVPLKCTKSPVEHIMRGPGEEFHGLMPWTQEFTIDYARGHPEYWKGLRHQ
jgi:hypothetical protein